MARSSVSNDDNADLSQYDREISESPPDFSHLKSASIERSRSPELVCPPSPRPEPMHLKRSPEMEPVCPPSPRPEAARLELPTLPEPVCPPSPRPSAKKLADLLNPAGSPSPEPDWEYVSNPTPKRRRQSLRITHGLTDALLFEAGKYLAAGEPLVAQKIYSRVLYETCPGHVVALLNRALAYLVLDYPELAVMDAYRAAELCCEIEVEQNRALRFAAEAKEARNWRVENVRGKGTKRPEAGRFSNVANEEPQRLEQESSEMEGVVQSREHDEEDGTDCDSHFESDSEYEESRDEALFNAEQQIHSYLRKERVLAEAKESWTQKPNCFVGKGWLGERLASIVVSDRHFYKTSKPDRYNARLAIQTLECHAVYRLCGALWKCDDGAIADAMDILSSFTVNNKEIQRHEKHWKKRWIQMELLGNLITQDAIDSSCEDYDWTAAIMKSRQTLVKRVIYPWNTYQPDLEDPDTCEEFADMVGVTAPNCAPNYEPATQELPGYAHLVATEDIMPGQALLEEYGLLNVSLPTEEETLCATCGVLLIAEDSKALKTADVEVQLCPTPYQGSLSRKCLIKCKQCDVYYCSDQCYALADDFHPQLCGLGGDKLITAFDYRRVNEERNPSIIQPEEWYLYTSALLRILSMSIERQMHPLELEETKWLNGAFRIVPENGLASQKARRLPWRFDMCVVQPMRLLKTLGYATSELLSHFDGWVLNTLFAKIIESMWITHGPKYAKTYDQQGKLVKGGPPPQPVNKNLWMGSLDTVGSMIPIIEQSDEADTNAVVVGGQALECYAFRHPVQTIWRDIAENARIETKAQQEGLSDEDMVEPAIKEGEFICRPDITLTPPEQSHSSRNENKDEEMTDAQDGHILQTGFDQMGADGHYGTDSQEMTDGEDSTTDSSWTRGGTEECEQCLKKVSL